VSLEYLRYLRLYTNINTYKHKKHNSACMYLSACRPKVSRLKICMDTFKKHKNRDT